MAGKQAEPSTAELRVLLEAYGILTPVKIVNLQEARALPFAAAIQVELPLYEKTSRSSIR